MRHHVATLERDVITSQNHYVIQFIFSNKATTDLLFIIYLLRISKQIRDLSQLRMVKNNSRRGGKPPPAGQSGFDPAKDGNNSLKRNAVSQRTKGVVQNQRSPIAPKQRKLNTGDAVEKGTQDDPGPLTKVVEGRVYFVKEKLPQKNTNSNSSTVSPFSATGSNQNRATKNFNNKGKPPKIIARNDFREAGLKLRSGKFISEENAEFVVGSQDGTHFVADGVRVDVHASEDEFENPPTDDDGDDLDQDPELDPADSELVDQELEDGQYPEEEEPDQRNLVTEELAEQDRLVGEQAMEGHAQGRFSQQVDEDINFNFRREPARDNSRAQAERLLADNPHLGNIFQQMIQQGVEREVRKQIGQKTPKQGNGKGGGGNNPNPHKVTNPREKVGLIKSPSDTTVYAPALHMLNESPQGMSAESAMDKISSFVEGIRLETQHRVTPTRGIPQVDVVRQPQASTSREPTQPDVRIVEHGEQDELEVARKRILESEQFNATIEPPPKGRNLFPDIDMVKRSEQDDLHDDEFFHLTCHVDKNLKSKIEMGEFIDLEKLLPRRKLRNGNEENRLEWVSRDGMTYLAPAHDRECQINSIRRWEQAFRIYAAIYCNANPTRSGEIWQYIHTINSAASSYQWDNVQYYDTVFRQMMGEKPGRNWSKTYVQLWQLALRDPLPKISNSGNNRSSFGSTGNQGDKHKQKNWRDNCCWRFNRTGKCGKENCPFDKRCSYCGMWNSHGSNSCRKRLGVEKDSNNSGNTQSTQPRK